MSHMRAFKLICNQTACSLARADHRGLGSATGVSMVAESTTHLGTTRPLLGVAQWRCVVICLPRANMVGFLYEIDHEILFCRKLCGVHSEMAHEHSRTRDSTISTRCKERVD